MNTVKYKVLKTLHAENLTHVLQKKVQSCKEFTVKMEKESKVKKRELNDIYV